MSSLRVRAATDRDLAWLIEQDGHSTAPGVAAKLERGEILVAELDGSSATSDEAGPQAWHDAVGFEPCGELQGINDHDVSEIVYLLRL